jgi:ATP-binding cassette, subfamily B, bacterial
MNPAATAAPTPPTPLRELYAQVWQHARGARARLLFALSLLGTSQVLKLALPWLTAQAINAIQTRGRNGLADAALWIGAIVALNVGVWMLHGPGRILERGVAMRVRRSMADMLYAKLADAPLAWHEQRHSGELQHRVGQASGALSNFTQSQFIYLQTLIYLVGPLVALWLLSPLTGALAMVGFVAVAFVVLRFDRALMKLAAQENDAERRYVARLLDFVGNISAVASLRLQQATRALLDARLVALFAPLRRSILLIEGKWCAVDLLTMALSWSLVVVYALSQGGILPVGAAAPGSQVLLVGNLLMAHQYAQQAAGVLVSMAANFQGLAHMRADFASAEPIRHAPASPLRLAPVPSPWRTIELQDLGFAHGALTRSVDAAAAAARDITRPGIHGVTLRLHRGQSVALVGASGCGKSTLMRVLAGLYEAQHGRVLIDGVAEPGRRQVADLSTLIPQEAEVFEASLRDNLTLGVTTDDDAVQRAVAASALDDVVAALPRGLDTAMAERGTNLSGGQRQRLALARGLLAAGGSSLLLLDEPTSALDALTEQRVFERIRAAHADACIVASVHRMSLLPWFDRVVFLHEGRVADSGSVAELEARQPLFAAMRRGVAREVAAVRPPGSDRQSP